MAREYGIAPVPEAADIGEELHDFLEQMRRAVQDINRTGILSGAVAASGGSSGGSTTIVVGGGGSGGTYTPDLTPPPTPSGASVLGGFGGVFFATDSPVFSQGHGYLRTFVYGAKWTAGPLPTFASAVLVHEFVGSVGSMPSDLGVNWHFWFKWMSVDGVLSSSPAGGTNGLTATIGKIGNVDLGPLIIEADNIANNAVTSDHLSAGSIAVGSAAIANGAIRRALIELAAIDNARIADVSATKLTAGKIQVGEQISSSTYVAGVSGWMVHGNGAAEFGAASIRGKLTASQIDTRNLTIKDAAGTVLFSASQNLDINRLAAGVDFQPDIAWDFTGTEDGWTANQATLTPGPNELYVGSTNTDPQFLSPVISLSGARSPLIRLRILRSAGSWEGILYYSTAGGGGHGFSGSFYKAIPAPPENVWTTIELDMAALTAGGSDWTSSTITQLRLDFFNATGCTVAVDWAGIGRQGPLRITGANVSTFIGDAAIASAQIANASINNAHIADLSVDSVKIANNAVSVPTGNQLTADVSPSTPGVEQDLLVAGSIDPSGGPVILMFTISVTITIPSTGSNGGTLRVKLGGATVFEWIMFGPPSSTRHVQISKQQYVASPGAGSLAVKITGELPPLYGLGSFSLRAESPADDLPGTSIVAIGLKK